MSSDELRITLLGSNSGNNLGDAAILSSILFNFRNDPFHFFVPTPKPDFVKLYKNLGNSTPIDIHPLRGLSIRFLGFPTIRAISNSEFTLICDGILFGKRLLDPSFNFLSNIYLLLPLLGKSRLGLFCCGIGPFNSKLSKALARAVLNSCEFVFLRDEESISIYNDLTGRKDAVRVGDAAFINPVSEPEIGRLLLEGHGVKDFSTRFIGVNLTSYLGSWVGNSMNKEDFSRFIVDNLKAVKRKVGINLIFFSTHPMDDSVNQYVANQTEAVFVPAKTYLSHDVMAAMSLCELFVGMRFHSLVLASSVGVPVLGIAYAPKVRSLLRLLNSNDLIIEFDTLAALEESMIRALNNLHKIKERQQAAVFHEKQLAEKAFNLFREIAGVKPSQTLAVNNS